MKLELYLHPQVVYIRLSFRETRYSQVVYTNSNFSGYTSSQKIPSLFRLIPDKVPKQTSISPAYLQHVPPMTPFIPFLKEYVPIHRDVQIVTRSGRVAQPPPVDRPFAGT